jgi:uncharacterized repeat protein (TIGR01451 family)
MAKLKRKTVTIIILVITGLLGVIGIVMAYTIYRARQVTPQESQAASCCSCNLSIGIPDEYYGYQTESVFSGLINPELGGKCELNYSDELVVPLFISDDFSLEAEIPTLTTCEDATSIICDKIHEVCQPYQEADCEFDPNIPHRVCAQCSILESDCEQFFNTTTLSKVCETSCMGSGPATFSEDTEEIFAIFKLQYALPGNEKIVRARLEYEPPAGVAPIETVDIEVTEDMIVSTETDDYGTIKTYRVPFGIYASEVIREDPGTYTLRFSALEEAGDGNNENDWTSDAECPILYTVLDDEDDTTSYCTDLDVAPTSGTTPLDVTLTASASNIDGDDEVTYKWYVDENCDGSVSESEIYESTEETIEKTFSISDDQESVSCESQVEIFLNGESTPLEERSDGLCTGRVIVYQADATAVCGNEICEEGEICDTDTNCQTGQDLTDNQTCGGECSLIEISEPPIDDDQDDDNNDDTDVTPSSEFSVTVVEDKECLERVTPNNTIVQTITVSNIGDSEGLIRAVSDTLPQGFSYVAGSSIINGTANTSDTGVIMETSGNSQLITWNNGGSGWTLAATTGTLTIQFSATAGPNALTGEQIQSQQHPLMRRQSQRQTQSQ